ncbi:protocadherin Fat 1 isoform X3 [Xenopus tropicalis]|uniref:FAT atypical cadherin 1 n=1 Tax=Xenopus tropicalis TaxID=8364 RepID=A0A6I8R7Y0_XENTR|nr:protocadherin Fat 1 isoform X3 [Xenopus tropicalis]|eukprot:XP_002940912.2 PREDICTED: protocadherin Fat 1 isoform X3 [Xenopus tropicalis]
MLCGCFSKPDRPDANGDPCSRMGNGEEKISRSWLEILHSSTTMGRYLIMLLLLLILQHLGNCEGSHGLHTSSSSMQFTQYSYNATVYENSAAKTYVGHPTKMGIYLKDPSWDIKYKIISGDNENIFKAEEHNLGDFCFLRIRTKGGNTAILNREVKDNYLLTVKAVEKNSNAEARTRIRVQVLDTNDLRPLFSPTSYSVSLPENTAIRSSIAKVTATDADIGTNGEFYYSFKERTDMFAIHPTSGTIVLTGRLDYTETKHYEMEILAVDRGLKLYGSSGISSMARLNIYVEQANEHAPVISAVRLTHPELDKDLTYAIVTVDDNDQGPNGEIASLSIIAGDPLQLFKTTRTSPGSKEYKIVAVKETEWEMQPFGYNLTLQAKDKGSPPQFSATKVIHLTSSRFKYGAVKFEKDIYRTEISEFAPPNTPVVLVKAVPSNSHIKYAFRNSADKNRFSINPNTGLISTLSPVKAKILSHIELDIITSDKKAFTKVLIKVLGTNINTPEFTQTSYKAVVDENSPIGSSVFSVHAVDHDEGENGFITYSIANINPQPFAIDAFSGVITTLEDLDYELMPRIYTLKIRASDWGLPYRRETEIPVTITLNNLNDNIPLFEKVNCEGTVPKDLGVGEQITTVSAIDADELQLVKYRIESGDELDLFTLNPNSGVLSLKQPLSEGPANKVSFYSLRITATDGENLAQPIYINITVTSSRKGVHLNCEETGVAKMLAERLLQANKLFNRGTQEEVYFDSHMTNTHAPHFKSILPSIIAIKENVPVGANIIHMEANDLDAGFSGKLLYAISGGNDDSCFAVDMETGWLKILSPLDRELKDQYNLNITVYDLGIPQKSSWRLLDVNVLDVNDNPPEFLQESYSVHLKENEEGHNAIIQVQAVDKDLGVNGEVKYSILTDTDIFTINSETGVIKAVAPLDREKQHTHLLKIEARDQAENEPQLFSHVLLKVTVEDVNDNPPVFIPSNYHVKVREDLPVGTVITWLDAYDPDVGLSGQVRFSLLENGDGKFEVDKVSGAVRIIQELDFEEKQVYNLTARAKDRGKPVSLSSACYINVELIDVNENLHTPLFSEFVSKGSIREDVPIGTPVMTVSAHDEDTGRDGEIRYSIRDGSGVGVFTIHEEKGTIRTADNLDRETTSHYWLTVYATDRGVVPLSSFIQIYIEIEDVNDNAPQTVEPVYYPEVMENSAKDVSVVQINAFDPDSISSDKLTYKISTGNPQGFFAINPKTGLITTTSRKLDREQQSEHILEVTITDNGHPAKSAVTRVIVKVLDENDNKPQFLQKFYKIRLPEREKPERERNAKRDPIYRVVAVDKDDGANAEISYSIEEGDEHGKFFIEPKTGVVSSKKSSAAGEYDILSIKAVDNGRPQKSSTTRLHIEWIAKPAPSAEPITFEEPSFSFSVMESDPVAHMIGVITTEPLGSPLWFDITGGNYDSRFDVDKGTGTIIVARPLDAEQKSNYNLTVEATDGTRSVSTQVSIKVIDTNDHRPEFSTSKYEVLIPEDVQPDTEILQVIAIDRDEKNKLIYTLQSSTDPVSLKKFRMDPATGSLYTTEKLDHETMQQHILTVMVRDQDVPVLRNFARIVINVTDTNDHAPWFTSSFYEGRVYESAAVGSAVLQVSALDKDKGKNAEVGYSIESGNTANAFTIDPVLGIIKTAKELDRNNHGRYELVVKATDHGIPPLSQITSIHIFVTISNNAAPKFTKKEYSSEISETAHVGSFVAMLSAYSQSSVVYEIRDGNTLNSFDINPNSGVVTTQKQLDFETLPSFTLTVQATNMAGLSTNSTLTVHVRDENDNFPVFAQTNYRGLISESAPPNSVVLTDDNIPLVIRATDSDQESNALLVYQIVEPSVHKYFAIDSSTGALRTLLSLDYEQTNIFHFTVQVHDMGYPRLFAENAANVTIYVVDINDCAPVFSKDVYETSLLLPTYKGVRVITVNATDDDSGAYSQLIYSIIEGNIGDKFLIDPLKGTITVQNTTNLRSRYELTIRASDGRFSSLTSVKINVKESKESSLKFTQRSYSATVLENATKVKTLTIISPLGSRINEPLFFHILNPDPRFKISPTSGVLSTTGIPFDREEEDLFELVVEVSDEQKPPTVAHVLVQVTVEDVNDNNPVFVNLPYYAMVQIDAPEGHLIRHVTAVDRDIGKNGEITYYLKEHSQQFQIGPSGEIKLKKQFDPDSSNKEYFITVVAKDSGNPSYSSEVVVPITVMNKAMPVFENPFYSAEIAENANLHSPVVHVQANSPEGYRIIYSITDGDPFNQFNINFNTGVINVFAPLDFESHPAYKLRVRATDSLTGAHAEVFVDIILEDVNDNPPVFREKTYAATLSEASVIGTSVVQINAKDPDSGQNNAISFHLVETSGNISQYFHIDASSGLIETAKPLDYEYFQECTLVVRATDNGIPPLSNDISVHIGLTDLNDNPPAFIQQVYEVKISELSKPGHFVTCVKATDADSSDTEKLEYSILSGNDDMNFIINSKTGVITVSYLRKMILNPFYSINVSVSDGVFRSSAQVHVTVKSANLHSPKFGQNEYEVELSENSPVQTLVTELKAVDEDKGLYGQLTYHIINDFAKDNFNINERGQLFTAERFDREIPTNKVIPVSVMAKDTGGKVGFCIVNVILTDSNDNVPQFRATEYKVSIASDVPRGTPIVKVIASDSDEGANADIFYSIEAQSASVEENFGISQSSGTIITKESLIGLEDEVYSFFVKATDGGTPQKESLVPVFIRILPPEVVLPKFSEPFYTLSISEDTAVGTELDVVKAESNEPIIYSLMKGNTLESNLDDVFVIDKQNGRLKLEKQLDHESTKWYQFYVLAHNLHGEHEIISSVDVSILVKDVNDNAPVFDSNPYKAFIVENLPEGTKVVQVRAFDLDVGSNGQVSYMLGHSQDLEEIKELFSVDRETGWVTTLGELDHEKTNKYHIVVVAYDHGDKVLSSSSTIEVTVMDVNDNPPRFTAEIYKGTVSEDDPPDGVIAILSTTDNDTEEINKEVTFHITGGDPLGQFAIENMQHEWKVYVRKPLDREVKDNYLLNITATDGTFATKAVVEVKVLDANDNTPVCEKTSYAETISEDALAGRVILQVAASDADIRSNAEIIYTLHGVGAEKFHLNPFTGELKTSLPLDREILEVYHLMVKATDGGGRFCQAAVELTLEDVNDNAPEFSADPYTVTVYENTEPQTPLLRVQAIDADLGLNHKVQYSLVSSAEGQFSIDELSGIISLEKPLDRELQAVYTLTVKATDQGLPRKLSSVASVVVSVLDINDNPPVFEHREYGSSLTEDAPVGTEVLQVYATSRDIEVNAEITYKIISGNEHGKFTINPVTGMIFIIASLDYETSPEYYLTVEATDGGTPPLSDVASVNINVTDVNDNSPVFSQNTYTTVVGEDSVSGQSVLMVVADDADGPLNNHIRYSITEGNPGNTFIIDPVRGEVKVNKLLDRELISGYTLTIQAEDNGQPPRRNTTTVNIDVSDVNDNPPMFSKGNYSIVIQENKPVGFSILHLAVTDKDSSHNGPPFTFVFLSGNEDNTFQMDEQGLITTAGTLSRKIKDLFVLHIQVSDNGKPQLSSFTNIEVRVIEESIHPPAILPLEIYITTFGEEYSGGVIGKVHATDQDVYDTLTYSLDPKMENLFSVSKTGGKLIARKQLDVGQYLLNVSVSDGKFTTAADITVHIRQITQELLNHSITFRFANLSPEEFIGDYWRNFQRSLRNHLGGRKIDIQIISLQPSEPPRNLDVLLAAEKVGNTYFAPKVLIQKINASIAEIEDISGVKILDVFHKLCLDVECPLRFCDEKISVDESVMSTHSTARLSFVTPRHHRRAICLCKGGKCPTLDSLCDGNTCPEGTECVVDVKEGKFNCVCPSDRPGQCNVGSSVTFTGNSYIKYRLMENENKEEMKLSLKLRTYSAHAVVMYARGTDYSILEIQGGKLQYKFDCGSGPGIVSVQSIHVNDGQWHTVSLEVDGNYARLVLDRVHTASGTAPGTLRTLNLDNHVFFGGHMRQQGSKHGRNLQVTNGFRGCMDAVLLNGQELPLNSKSKNNVHIEESVDISSGCSLSAADVCSGSPCQNGGTCSPLSNGGYYCKCSSLFMGTHCDISINPCASNPCLYGGTCIVVKEDFMCHCRGDYTGPRCQFGPYCKDNPCKNSGKCIDSLDGPVCECESGFHGDKCLNDIDECLENPCPTGAMCENTYGSYSCNCSNGYGGKLCTDVLPNKYVSTSWNIGLAEVIGIIVFIAGTFSIVVIFVVCRTVANKKKKKRQSEPEDKHSGATSAFLPRQFLDPKVNKNIYSDIPPQVPVRPISYTPSIPSDSRNNLDRNSFEGSTIPEHPEFSTFNPDSVHGHRKAVAVCSVAPNLPPPPPSNSPSDSDSIQKPSWDYDYDAKVDLDPCLSKKSLDEKACHLYNPRESMSEIQSLSSFQSESCDDNESFAVPEVRNSRGYHWDTSDWMPSVQLPDIQEYPHYEVVEEPAPHYTDPNVIDTDYYPGGYDIENDFPPPPDDFPLPDELPPLPPEYTEQYDSMQPSREMPVVGSLGSSTKSSPRYNLNKYLPRHQYPTSMSEPQSTTSGDGNSYREPYAASYMLGFNRDFEVPIVDNMSMSGYTSAASCTDVSAGCEMESEVMMSDYESGDDGHFEDVTIPPLDSQHHTEV